MASVCRCPAFGRNLIEAFVPFGGEVKLRLKDLVNFRRRGLGKCREVCLKMANSFQMKSSVSARYCLADSARSGRARIAL